jgi:hypothetical protein
MGKIAHEGAVAFRALSLVCGLAAQDGEALVEAEPLRMNRRQAYLIGRAAGQRHYFSFFQLSNDVADMARFRGTAVRNIESDARRSPTSWWSTTATTLPGSQISRSCQPHCLRQLPHSME